jgi:predicted O-methyltransferase YrrM
MASRAEHELADERARRVLDRLAEQDAAERALGLPQEQRIRALTPATGAFLYGVLLALRPPLIFEAGSAVGYSTIWLALAARAYGGRVIGSEIRPERVAAANANLAAAGLQDVAVVLEGDAAELVRQCERIDFLFLDAEKDDYGRLFLAAFDRVVPGGLIVADNVVSHDCRAYQEFVRSRSDVLTITIPFERGLEWTIKRW